MTTGKQQQRRAQILTVNDRIDEKKVPSSYLDSFDNTPSNTATNYKQYMVFRKLLCIQTSNRANDFWTNFFQGTEIHNVCN